MRLKSTFLIPAILLALSGCSKFSYQGTWTGTGQIPQYANLTPAQVDQLGKIKLVITGDKFELDESAFPIAGHVEILGDKALLHTETMSGRPIPQTTQSHLMYQDIELTPGSGGSLSYTNPRTGSTKITLTKQN